MELSLKSSDLRSSISNGGLCRATPVFAWVFLMQNFFSSILLFQLELIITIFKLHFLLNRKSFLTNSKTESQAIVSVLTLQGKIPPKQYYFSAQVRNQTFYEFRTPMKAMTMHFILCSATNRDFSNQDLRILGLIVLFFRTFCSKSDFFRPIFGSKSDFYA